MKVMYFSICLKCKKHSEGFNVRLGGSEVFSYDTAKGSALFHMWKLKCFPLYKWSKMLFYNGMT